jgi:hypothetical protein
VLFSAQLFFGCGGASEHACGFAETLQAVNAKQAKALARKTEEHACAMRCLQKFAVNNRLLGQMMVRKKTRHPPILVELDD